MANAIKDKVTSNGYKVAVYDTYADLANAVKKTNDCVYFVKKDETNSNAPVSYTYNTTTSKFVLLSQVSSDLMFYDLFPKVGSVDTLYCHTVNNYIYQWDDTAKKYVFLCEVYSNIMQQIVGVTIKYSLSKSSVGIDSTITYTVGFDTRVYLSDGTNKIYTSLDFIAKFFKPSDGRAWSDISVALAVSVVISVDNSYMVASSFDSNGNKIIDLAENAQKFNNMTADQWKDWIKNNTTVDFTPVINKIGDTTKITDADLVTAINNSKLSILAGSKRNSPAAGLSLLGSMLDGREGQVINVLGDSTGNETTEWVYMLGQKIATAYPNYNVRYSLINKTTYIYDNIINIQDDGNARNFRFSGSGNIPQLDKEQVPLTSPDLDVRIKLSLDKWAEGTNKTLISRYGNTAGSKGWRLGINTGNFLIFHWTEDGSTDKAVGYTVSTSQFADGTTTWLRVTMDVDNGASGNTVAFYKSADGLTWTQLGSNIVTATATSIYSPATQKYEIGGYNSYSELITGNIYDVQIMDGIDGVNVAPRLIDSWKQPTSSTPAATLQGTPEIFIYNASIQGYGNTEYADPTLLKKLIVNAVCPLMFISLGHNDLNRQGYDLFNTWDTLISRIRSYSLNPLIVACTQNPRISPALWGREQGIRRRMWMSYAQKSGISVVDTYLAFLQSGLPLTSLVNTTDGIHPVLAGEQIWCNEVWKFLSVI